METAVPTAPATVSSSARGAEVLLRGVSRIFSSATGEVTALSEVDLTIEPGEFVCIVGPSGCGKTTIMNMVAGLMQPSTGSVTLDGKAPRTGDPRVGYLLARDSLLPWRTALQNVALPMQLQGTPRAQAETFAADMLQSVGLADFVDNHPAQLSHGMRQRVAVARTLAPNPTTILFDEPFSALDAQTRLNLQARFIRLWEEHRSTVIFITHDLAEAISLGDRVIVMSARPGRVLAQFSIDIPRPRDVLDLQGEPQFHEYYQQIWQIIKQEMSEQ